MMLLFGENPQVNEFVKGMDKTWELLGLDGALRGEKALSDV